jgi:hypothetical protein
VCLSFVGARDRPFSPLHQSRSIGRDGWSSITFPAAITPQLRVNERSGRVTGNSVESRRGKDRFSFIWVGHRRKSSRKGQIFIHMGGSGTHAQLGSWQFLGLGPSRRLLGSVAASGFAPLRNQEPMLIEIRGA